MFHGRGVLSEGLRTRAAKLAAASAALKRLGGIGGFAAPFSLAFLTDRRRLECPEPILRVLPAGAAVVYRDYDHPRRAAIAHRYAAICNSRGVFFIVGGDLALARAVGADGVHFPARMLASLCSGVMRDLKSPPLKEGGEEREVFARALDFIVTAACHSQQDLRRARAAGAGLAFLSPAFATASHPGAEHLGAARFKALAASSPIPVLALGGVDERTAPRLAGENVCGFGAILGFA